MPNHDATARSIFAEMNALAGRHDGESQIVILGAIMAWASIQAEAADEDALAMACAIAASIEQRATPVEAMN